MALGVGSVGPVDFGVHLKHKTYFIRFDLCSIDFCAHCEVVKQLIMVRHEIVLVLRKGALLAT